MTSREKAILFSANRLFIENGYEGTTMRQISEGAGVSLGLTTYHFKVKRQLGYTIMRAYIRYLKDLIAARLRPDDDLLLPSAAFAHLGLRFFLNGPCRRFYLECLNNNIHMECIQSFGTQTMLNIASVYKLPVSNDELLLFDNYIPPSAERILCLEKEAGSFPGISYDRIPEIVFSISAEHYFDKDRIAAASRRGYEVAMEALAEIPENITETLFL